MADLIHSLQGRDLGHLRIVAELWGKELAAPDARVGLLRLVPMLLERDAVTEVVQALPENARFALDELLRNEGRLQWSVFERRYGTVREMGAARRDRERPYQGTKASAAEALWYRALIARDFFDIPSGPEEFAYIPEDLLVQMPPVQAGRNAPMGRQATPGEKAQQLAGGDAILDDACTLLAALRIGLPERGVPARPGDPSHYLLVGNQRLPYPLSAEALQALLFAAGLVDKRGAPIAEPVRRFLEAGRNEALLCLTRAWLRSATFNDLRLMPGVTAEGEWQNDPQRARRAILDYLFTVPGAFAVSDDPAERPFWSLGALVGAVRQTDPDFQRSAGEYDAWYLRDQTGGEYLRGFEHWDDVEGALIRFLIGGPLFWLGIVDLGLAAANGNGEKPEKATIASFRFTAWAANLLNLEAPKGFETESEKFTAGSDGRLRVPRRSRRSLRYQTARFAAWEKIAQDHYVYRLTPASLLAAKNAGLRVAQLLALLRKYAQPTPPNLIQALERWEAEGSQARLDRLVVLRVKDPALLQTIRGSKLGRYLGEPLGPAAVIVRAGALDKLVDGLAEMGYLGEVGWVRESPE